MSITRQDAESDTKLYPLMNFLIGHVNELKNWEDIIKLKYFPENPVMLYRGLISDMLYENKIHFQTSRCTSWSRNRKVAEKFAGSRGAILSYEFDSSYMVFDTRHLAKDLFVKFQWQEEIIIKPIFNLLDIKIDYLN